MKRRIIVTVLIPTVVILFVFIYSNSITAYSVSSKKQSHAKSSELIQALDNNHVPIVDYGYVNGIYVGPARNPITIAHKALSYYDALKIDAGNAKAKKSLINNANWLVDNAVTHGNYSIFEYKFQWPPYGLKQPWYSAMAQGEGIKALVRAYEVTKDKKYLDTAKMLLGSFFVEVKDEGVTYKTSNGWWYEEYASKDEPRESRVLNGMMYALLGVHEYYDYTHDSKAKYIFDQGVTALKNSLPRYNYRDNYTYYDILGNISPLQYHKAVIQTLGPLYDITKEQIFKTYFYKWKHFKEPSESML